MINEHLQVENLTSFNWEGALRGMRNPKESWAKSDSGMFYTPEEDDAIFQMGPNDHKLAMTLARAGKDHRKFLRQIFVSCDIVAPWYFWKEYETYQVGTVENSTSQMHKMGSRPLTKADFVIDEWDHYDEELLALINRRIEQYKRHNGKAQWRALIQIIPASFIYRRTCTLNYEVLANMYHSRKDHKLIEWHEFLDQMIAGLPYPELFTLEGGDN